MKRIALWTTFLLLLITITGCTKWYNPAFAEDPQKMQSRLTLDKKICTGFINQTRGVPTSVDWTNRDPVPESRVINVMNNWETGASREMLLQRCLKSRGWVRK
ncbi:hypothetical protein [Desulfovibrio inopinatus]|uniref:hypothetical protein n=1 Tax=Desulfovibrio inopinatus TaxID=102109 RepID=UPI000414D7E2|nr:hypothetical protein [Desulfovibrio inopinatus]